MSMTRKEAIQKLRGLVGSCPLKDGEWKAVEMGIEALTENESLAKSVIEASELLRKKRPHGEWIKGRCETLGALTEDYYNCSECGHETTWRTNYCPNCGANMRER